MNEQITKPKGKRSTRKAQVALVVQSEQSVTIGRPSIYSEEIANEICRRIAGGESLLTICKDENLPGRSTVHEWLLDDDKSTFADKYARARDMQAEYLFDEILELSDGSIDDIVGDDKSDSARVNARRLQVDSRKWYLSKVLPKKYGDKIDVTSGGERLPTQNAITFINFGQINEKQDAVRE